MKTQFVVIQPYADHCGGVIASCDHARIEAKSFKKIEGKNLLIALEFFLKGLEEKAPVGQPVKFAVEEVKLAYGKQDLVHQKSVLRQGLFEGLLIAKGISYEVLPARLWESCALFVDVPKLPRELVGTSRYLKVQREAQNFIKRRVELCMQKSIGLELHTAEACAAAVYLYANSGLPANKKVVK